MDGSKGILFEKVKVVVREKLMGYISFFNCGNKEGWVDTNPRRSDSQTVDSRSTRLKQIRVEETRDRTRAFVARRRAFRGHYL